MAIIIIYELKGNDALEKYPCNTRNRQTIEKKSTIEKEWQITKSSYQKKILKGKKEMFNPFRNKINAN